MTPGYKMLGYHVSVRDLGPSPTSRMEPFATAVNGCSRKKGHCGCKSGS